MGGSAPGGGVFAPGGVCSWGVSAPRGMCLLLGGGVSALGGSALGGVVSQHALRQTPPLLTESQTRVKT